MFSSAFTLPFAKLKLCPNSQLVRIVSNCHLTKPERYLLDYKQSPFQPNSFHFYRPCLCKTVVKQQPATVEKPNKNYEISKTLLVLSLFFSGMFFANAEVFFYEEDVEWSDVLHFASSENKLIFVDVYADYCKPCKIMDKEVFGNLEIASYMNPRFINYKVDAGDDFHNEFENSFDVEHLPATFIFDPSGKELFTFVGMHTPEKLMTEVRNAMIDYHGTENPTFSKPDNFIPAENTAGSLHNNPNNGTGPFVMPDNSGIGQVLDFDLMTRDFESGSLNHKPEILEQLAYYLKANGKPYDAVVETYIEHYKNVLDKDNREMAVFIFDIAEDNHNAAAMLIAENAEFYGYLHDPVTVNEKLLDVAYKDLDYAVKHSDKAILDASLHMVKIGELPNANHLIYNNQLYYFQHTNDWENYAETCKEYLSAVEVEDPVMLASIGWNFVLNVNDRTQLEYAAQWMEKSIALENECYNNYVVSELWYRLGEYNEAREAAYKTIDLAKIRNMDYSASDDLLNRIEAQESNDISAVGMRN